MKLEGRSHEGKRGGEDGGGVIKHMEAEKRPWGVWKDKRSQEKERKITKTKFCLTMPPRNLLIYMQIKKFKKKI